MNLFDLHHQTALITGASSGLGEQFARCLSRAGARMILAARNLEKLETLSQELKNALPLQMDVADKTSIQRVFELLEERGERVDVCVNCAGFAVNTPVFKHDDENTFTSLFETNVLGTWHVIQAVVQQMKQYEIRASIINISSVNATNCLLEETTGYSAAKAAVIQMTKALVGELGDAGIRINCIVPGLFRTPATEGMLQNAEWKQEVKRLIPLHFIAEPSDLDGTLLYLASNKASPYVTGSIITVDGGLSWGGAR